MGYAMAVSDVQPRAVRKGMMTEVILVDVRQLEIQPNVYYTLEEVAALLRVSRRNVVRLLESGIARGIKIGRHWRVLGGDLLQLPRQEEGTDAQLVREFMRLSEPAFARVWDNEEDAVYDNL
jgi:excisionase family DNA binding protein